MTSVCNFEILCSGQVFLCCAILFLTFGARDKKHLYTYFFILIHLHPEHRKSVFNSSTMCFNCTPFLLVKKKIKILEEKNIIFAYQEFL